MGLFKRLVVALETIANKKEDFSGIEKVLKNVIELQAKAQRRMRKIEKREGMAQRYAHLQELKANGDKMSVTEEKELELGKTIFDE